jgi:hypothetical protein
VVVDKQPNVRVIIGGAALIIACLLCASAVHSLVAAGTCSSTGYTQFGPAPKCPSGSGAHGALLAIGIVLALISAIGVEANVLVSALFVAIGIGSLLLGLSPPAHSHETTFATVFGAGFTLAGLAWIGIAGALAWSIGGSSFRRNKPARAPVGSPGSSAPTVAEYRASLGLPEKPQKRVRTELVGAQVVVAGIVWLVALAGAIVTISAV